MSDPVAGDPGPADAASGDPAPADATPAQGGGSTTRGYARVIEVLLKAGALTVMAVTWLYVAAAAFTDGTLLSDTWAWLSSLDAIAAFVVWLAVLPLVVFLWAWQADLEPWVMGLVMLGLVVWTVAALSGLRRQGRAATG